MTRRALSSIPLLLAAVGAATACNSITGVDDLIIQQPGGGGTAGAGTGSADPPPDQGNGGAPPAPGPTGTSSSSSGTTAASSSSSSTSSSGSSSSSSSSSSGGAVCNYPAGPYGVTSGAIVPANLAWQGYAEGSQQISSISIKDYLDCDGSKGIRALLIIQSATWCGVCQEEASELNAQAAAWSAQGIHVLTLMIEDNNGFPASASTAFAWKNAFDLSAVAVAADPNFSFAFGGSIGLPYSIVVDPRTMKVVTTEEGYSGDFSTLEQVAQKNAN